MKEQQERLKPLRLCTHMGILNNRRNNGITLIALVVTILSFDVL